MVATIPAEIVEEVLPSNALVAKLTPNFEQMDLVDATMAITWIRSQETVLLVTSLALDAKVLSPLIVSNARVLQ